MNFEDWMSSSTNLAGKSIGSYVGAIDGRLTNWAMINGILNGPIRNISDPSQFAAVSAKISATPEFALHNVKGRSMYSNALRHYANFLSSEIKRIKTDTYLEGPLTPSIVAIEANEPVQPFEPKNQEDARQKVLREVVSRRGQAKFRAKLIKAYEAKCAITGCGVVPILEAAHITPYLGPETNSLTNGLLLRSDIHTLWDLGLIALYPNDRAVWISPKINDTTYQSLSGTIAFDPQEPNAKPSIMALQQQWELVQRTK